MTAGERNLRSHTKLPSANSSGAVFSNASIPPNSFGRQDVVLGHISQVKHHIWSREAQVGLHSPQVMGLLGSHLWCDILGVAQLRSQVVSMISH